MLNTSKEVAQKSLETKPEGLGKEDPKRDDNSEIYFHLFFITTSPLGLPILQCFSVLV